jgi:hypothetical protein
MIPYPELIEDGVMEWLNVAEAARELGVSPRQVRHLAQAGRLPARRLSSGWMLAADAVRQRSQHTPRPGRPLSPETCWALLAVTQWLFVHDAPDDAHRDGGSPLEAFQDRRLRHRLRRLLARQKDSQDWQRLLARRATARPVWIHPGLLGRLHDDPRLRPGGSFAAAVHGVGIATGTPRRFYVDAGDVDAVLADYRARDDVDGHVELMVVPDEVPGELSKRRPLPLAVALADLLDSADARERSVAEQRLAALDLVERS